MPNQRDPNKAMVGLWIDKDIRNEIKAFADEENRNVSNMIETVMKSWLKRKRRGADTAWLFFCQEPNRDT